MNDMRPVVSVIITTYNQVRYISATIQSAIDQDFADSEIIVVDDGSTDDTPTLVGAFGHRVVSLRQPNQGVAGSRNAGIQQARGEFSRFWTATTSGTPASCPARLAPREFIRLRG